MRTSLIALVMILLSSCTPRLIPVPSPTQIPAADMPNAATPPPQADTIIALIRTDLSTRLSLDPQQIHVISVESVVWPDTALGCPHQDEVYAQRTVAGYQVILEAKDQKYVYHTDTEKTISLCVQEDLPSFPVTPGEIDDGEPWMPVD